MSVIGDILTRGARRHGESVALRFGERTWRYSELDRAASRVAAGLLGLGLERGDRVAAVGRNSDAYVLLFLGCARAGLVHVPVNHSLTGAELEYILGQSGAAAVFADPELAPTILDWASDPALELPRGVEVGERDLVQLLYTSGTTSNPKGAMMTHRAFIHQYVSCVVAFSLTERERMLSALPLYHSAPMHCTVLPHLAVGAELIVLEQPDPGEILERIERDRVTGFFGVPTLWAGLLTHPAFAATDLSSLRRAYYGASIMPQPILEEMRDRLPGAGLYQGFGQSEMGPLTTVLLPDEHAERPTSAGRSVLFVELRVVDEEMRDVQVGEPGEVVYRSEQACSGYWQEPELSEQAFAGGWFHSGDVARQDAEGYVYVVDRLKDVINTGGVLVASREVEDVLLAHPAVLDVAVVALPDPRWVEAITAFVVRSGHVEAGDLIAHARERLSGHKVPKAVRFVDHLPRNAVGKVLKRELRSTAPAETV